METLLKKHDRYFALTPTQMVRSIMTKINWNANLIALRGPRGIGKSTLLRQYAKLNYPAYDRQVLYCTLDSVYFSNHSLIDLAEQFYLNGGKRLLLDEVHKYPSWSKEIKEINDLYPDLKVVISGSSLLQILNGDADLSRRCLSYDMQGLSFREFLHLYKGIEVEAVTLDNLLNNAFDICNRLNQQCRPLQMFNEYLRYGYYPFYLEDPDGYGIRLEQVTRYVVETELTLMCHVETSSVRKILALMGILSNLVPFKVNIATLATTIGAERATVLSYLGYLNRAKLLNLLYADLKSVKKMQKPDKIYIENTNLIYALASGEPNIGTIRETFAVNQLMFNHEVEYGKSEGDLLVAGKYRFEIGGADKNYTQIADIPHSYILADGMETPIGNKLPLWLVGLLY